LCGAKLKAPDGASGRTLKCPQCSSAVVVSGSSDVARPPAVPTTASAQDGEARRPAQPPPRQASAPETPARIFPMLPEGGPPQLPSPATAVCPDCQALLAVGAVR